MHSGILNQLLSKQIDISANNPEKVSELEKYLKLYTTFTISNMHLFDQHDHLIKYENIQEIIENYDDLRIKYYIKRKENQLSNLQDELLVISNKARFINMNISDEIDLRKKKNNEIDEIMTRLKFDKDKIKDNYNYLTKMPMDSVSEENVEKLIKEKGDKEEKIKELKSKSIQDIWIEELEILKDEYNKFLDDKTNQSVKIIKKKPKK